LPFTIKPQKQLQSPKFRVVASEFVHEEIL
jgi:hypothetical protein